MIESASSATRSPAGGIWRRWMPAYIVLTAAVCLGYTFYTGHIWEDYFITFRHSRNLATGQGLVYQPGQRVHGFTSPINTLLPALFDRLTGSGSEMPALWLYRLASIAALTGGGLIVLRLFLERERTSLFAPAALVALTLLDFKTIAYTTNGQEAGFMILFLAWSLACLWRGFPATWRSAGLAWAGLMYTRPDGCVYIAAMGAVAMLTCGPGRPRELLGMLKSAGICAAAYSPWVVWATWYYGSPVPHTVLAKTRLSVVSSAEPGRFVKDLAAHWLEAVGRSFEPIYLGFGGWPAGVELFCLLVGLSAGLFWLVPSADRLGRIASGLFALMCLYMGYVNLSTAGLMPWYLPPVTFLGLIALAQVPAAVQTAHPRWAGAARGALVVILLGSAAIFLLGSYQVRIQQREIEDNHRKQIGLWLREHARDGDVIYLEPLGYIGFYSGGNMADWPGLVSPRVVQLRKQLDWPTQATVVPLLKPDWLVVRPREAAAMANIEAITREYGLVKQFDATPRLKAYGYIPGMGYLMFDARYLIYMRDPDLRSQQATQ